MNQLNLVKLKKPAVFFHENTSVFVVGEIINQIYQRTQRGFSTGQLVWDPKYYSQINQKLNM